MQFHRVAVGEHLILGGDNLDLALAHHLEQRLTEPVRRPRQARCRLARQCRQLEPRRWAMLVQTCRRLKETLLGADAPEQLTVNLPWSGSRLIGGGQQIEVTRREVHDLLVEGFFRGWPWTPSRPGGVPAFRSSACPLLRIRR